MDRFSHSPRENVKHLLVPAFLNVRLCCFSLLFMTLYEYSLGFVLFIFNNYYFLLIKSSI